MIEIKKEFGIITIERNGNEVLRTSDIQDVEDYYESVKDELEQETVHIKTFAADTDTFVDCDTLFMVAFLMTWGKRLYCGDAIEINITTTYRPEDK